MRKLFVLLLILGVLGFYVGWPAWSGWQIKQAFDTRNPALLETKVDFPAVRTSLKPIVETEVGRRIDKAMTELGGGGAVLGQRLKQEMAPKLAEAALNSIVTPANLVRIVAEGRDLRQSIERIIGDEMGKQGGLGAGAGTGGGTGGGIRAQVAGRIGGILGGGSNPSPVRTVDPNETQPKAATPTPAATPEKKFSVSNIKHFAPTGLASFEVGVARDPAATASEVIAEMAFTGSDWKLVALKPKI